MGDFLFGSEPETKQYSSLGLRSSEGQAAIDTILPTATNQYNLGAGLINKGTTWLNDLTTSGTNSYVDNNDAINGQLVKQQTNQNIGTTTNNMVNKGVMNSTMTQNALTNIGAKANEQTLAAHQQNLKDAYSIGGELLTSGTGLQTGLTDFSKLQEMLRQNSNDTVQEGGSTGLFGGLASSYVGSLGKKWGS